MQPEPLAQQGVPPSHYTNEKTWVPSTAQISLGAKLGASKPIDPSEDPGPPLPGDEAGLGDGWLLSLSFKVTPAPPALCRLTGGSQRRLLHDVTQVLAGS